MPLHSRTPTLAAVDSRGLTGRTVAYARATEQQPAEQRITHQVYDAAGRLISQQDPRLPTPNQTTTYTLSSTPLLTDSVDAGWRLALLDEAGQIAEQWDSRDTHRQIQYDELQRPVALRESVGARLARESAALTTRIVERFTYGGPDTAEHNQCNQLIRHDDPAGTMQWPDYSLLGSPVSEIRRFLLEAEMPDWPLLETERNRLLEPDEFASSWSYNALGDALEQIDAMGNSQRFAQTIAGQLKSVSVTLADSAQAETWVSDIRYNAFDQVEQETAGNGVISRYTYDLRDGRLSELTARLANHPPLQDLLYGYDPVGNITQIEDASQSLRFFANQRIEPINRYRYDTLYQLVEATGREVKAGSSHGPALPDRQNIPLDPNQLANYTQYYDYDAGGNLLQMRHVGAQSFTRTMLVASNSNRSLPEGEVEVDFETGFDANGNLRQLIRGQDLRWDRRNQLREVTAVKRDDGPDDVERYIYDGGGQRCRKIRSAQSRSRTLIDEVRYLPGLEIRSSADGEILYVISALAGRNSVRVLHWQANTPPGIDNDQLRYSLNDHLGSSTLELDHQGSLISQESYYPFGGTAWWAARSAAEAKYKTIRYSGKERDASGLYYYGFRYYAPWLQRWINPDPARDVDGLNIFCFVSNSPLCHIDKDGRLYEGQGDSIEKELEAEGYQIIARGLEQFTPSQADIIRSALAATTQAHQGALSMIRHFPTESVATMRSYFGYEHQSVTPDVILAWEKTQALSTEYQGQWGGGKFLGIDAKDDTVAEVNTLDPHGRIAINLDRLNNGSLSIDLGHELSHLGKVNNMNTVGAKTDDYYYLFKNGWGRLVNNVRPPFHDSVFQSVSEVVVGGGLNLGYFSFFRQLEADFIDRVQSLHQTTDQIAEIDTAISAFNRHPRISAVMSSENADSLVHAAYDLNLQYRSMLSRINPPPYQSRPKQMN